VGTRDAQRRPHWGQRLSQRPLVNDGSTSRPGNIRRSGLRRAFLIQGVEYDDAAVPAEL